jgi:hypothetical protein
MSFNIAVLQLMSYRNCVGHEATYFVDNNHDAFAYWRAFMNAAA